MRRIERRGKTRLKAVQLESDVAEQLRDYARQTNKPIRWHVERAVSAKLAVSAPSYPVGLLVRIASGIVSTVDSENIQLAHLVESLFRRCDKLSIPRPHVQTARKLIRNASTQNPGLSANLAARTARAFTSAEDRLIVEERTRGQSLGAISKITGRSRSVILRRLRWLETRKPPNG